VVNWRVFLPASFINLAFVPPELRVGFINVIFFGWSIYLSIVVNATD
jgi:peroxisomal membrane protein 2